MFQTKVVWLEGGYRMVSLIWSCIVLWNVEVTF